MELTRIKTATEIQLSNRLVRSIKELSGFQKHFRLPASSKEGSSFLSEIGKADIQSDLEQKFSALRSGFGFKRKQIRVNDPIDALGSIETPFFNYEFSITYVGEDTAKVHLTRRICEIRESSQILNPVFIQVFGHQFNALELAFPEPLQLEAIVDNIEELDSDEITVDYDKDLTWCQIKFSQEATSVKLQPNGMLITSPLQEVEPGELLRTFARVQHQFSRILKLNSLDFSTSL